MFVPHSILLSKPINVVYWALELIAKVVSDLKDSRLNYLPIAVDLY